MIEIKRPDLIPEMMEAFALLLSQFKVIDEDLTAVQREGAAVWFRADHMFKRVVGKD